MKKYFSFLLTIAVSFAIALSFSSCQAEIEPEAEVETGLPVEGLTFTVSSPMEEVVVTKASDAAETQVLNFTMIFIPKDDSGAIVITKDLYDEQKKTSTNYLYSVSLSADDLAEIHTGQYYLYAIANTGNGFISVDPASLNGMKKSQIDNVIIRKNDRQVAFTDASVLMSGKYCESGEFGDDDSDSCNGLITLHSGENKPTGRIHLRRAVSKSIFTIKTAPGVEFNPVSYDIVNFAQGEYLFEKAGAGFWNGSIPGSVPAVPGVEYISRTGLTNFTTNADGSVSFYFYMPESVQKASSSPASWTYASRETRNYSDSEHYGPFSYAPANAAYIVVRGSYKDSQYTGDATYTIHLGDFGQSTGSGHFDNFTVRRNYKYKYAVTVNSVSKIIAEAQSTSDSEQPGAEGNIRSTLSSFTTTLDAHFETVLVSMDYDGSSDGYTILTNTHFGQAQVSRTKGGAALTETQKNALDYKWIRFAKPGGSASSFTVSSYPGESKTVDIFTLFEEVLAGGTPEHYVVNGGKFYTVAYVNENFYDTNPITGEPVDFPAFVNGDNRSFTAALAPLYVSRDEHSTYAEEKGFTIVQRPIRTFYNTVGEIGWDVKSNPFGVETIEETPKARSTRTGTFDDAFGWQNFSNVVMNGTWSDRVNANNNVHKVAGDSKDNPLSNVMVTNTDPFYQCLSRNRDENGNGTIDREEIKWYLPSHVECIEFWYGMNGLEIEARLKLLGDTERGTNNYMSSTGGSAGTWWANEGTAFSSYSQGSSMTVRCVRALGKTSSGQPAYNQQTSLIYDFRGNNVIDISGLHENCSRGNMTGEYAEHFRSDQDYDKLPSAFKVAEKDLSIGEVNTIMIAPRFSIEHVDDRLFRITLENRSDYDDTYRIIFNGVNSVDGFPSSSRDYPVQDTYDITPAFSGTSSTVSVISSFDGVSSNNSSISIVGDPTVPAPAGTVRVTASGRQYTYIFTLSNYNPDLNYYYTTSNYTGNNTNSNSNYRSNRQPVTPSSSGVITIGPIANSSIYVWSAHKDDNSTIAKSSKVLISSDNTLSGQKTGTTANYYYSYSIYDYTVGGDKPVNVPGRKYFTLEEVKTKNLCSNNYYEESDKSDLHAWRIPNEKELGLLFQYWNVLGIVNMTSGVSEYTRQEVQQATAVFSIRNSSYGYTGNPALITTTITNGPGGSYWTAENFVIRCVRDVEPATDQGGGSSGGGTNGSSNNSDNPLGDGENYGGSGSGGTGSGGSGGF